MSINDIVQPIVTFVREHESWAMPVAFLVAFGESFAFLSLLWPGTAILVGISALLAASGMELSALWPAIIAAALGGSLGYAISYWIGYYFKDNIGDIWPFRTHPDLIPQGKAFFERYGAFGVFLGHFFGPVRAVIPVVAGMFGMRQLHFQVANILSALIWAAGVIAPSFFLVTFKDQIFQWMRDYQLVVGLVMFLLGLGNSVPHKLMAVPTLLAFVALGALQLYAGGNPVPIWLLGAAGAFVGDQIAYRMGQGLDLKHDFFFLDITAERLAKARAMIAKYGAMALMWSKYSAGYRASVPMAGGVDGCPRLSFIAASIVSSLLWSALLLTPRYIARLFGY